MAFGVKAVIDKFKGGNAPADGDVFIFNDPYLGGTHLSDMRLVRPVFRDGRIFCWLASVGHWHDVGGAVPGNYNPAATEYFQEGVLIPPVRLFSGGRLSQVVSPARGLPSANERFGDLNAHLSALDLGVARMAALLVNRHGNGVGACGHRPRGIDAAGRDPACRTGAGRFSSTMTGATISARIAYGDGAGERRLDLRIGRRFMPVANISRATDRRVYVAFGIYFRSRGRFRRPIGHHPAGNSCSTRSGKPPAATPKQSCASSTCCSAPSRASGQSVLSPMPMARSTPSPSPPAGRMASTG
jgi:hypothetical protein